MDRKHSCLPEVEELPSDAISAKAQGHKEASTSSQAELQTEPESEKHYRTISPDAYQRPAGMSYDDFQKQVRRDKRSARYEQVHLLFEQGREGASDCTPSLTITCDGEQICPGRGVS